MFRNAANGALNVVYRRPDGNIGWIDPERARTRTETGLTLTLAPLCFEAAASRVSMNDLSDLVAPDAILPRLLATSRRQALQLMADALAKSAGIDARAAFDAVLIRERLSGTGMGEGVAIPHAPVAGLDAPDRRVRAARAAAGFRRDGRTARPISCSCCSRRPIAAPIT